VTTNLINADVAPVLSRLKRSAHQSLDKYAHLVPFIEGEKEVFLKTIIPSRKATKRYLG